MHAPAAPTIPPEMLLLAYRSGIFPMADGREDPEIFYVEPRRRAILPLDGFRCSHSLAKLLRKDRLRVTCNADFAGVIAACAEPRPEHPETWISRRIEASYRAMHLAGHAHSIEVWDGESLVGGLYGVGFDGVFCGESMFSHADNASKVALAWLVAAMRFARMSLLDCQFMTEHLASMGAIEIGQDEYCERLAKAQTAGGVSAGAGGGVAGAVGAGAPLGLPEGFALLLGAGASSPGKLIAQALTHTS
ncbi:MAG: leucyl/phenylalanyl-tRNA--protein transferase [Porphyrobacter sp.]|nr:leucyl/phenylalanyl-tRNA--protein transferase [Porphyrobacter sp.]